MAVQQYLAASKLKTFSCGTDRSRRSQLRSTLTVDDRDEQLRPSGPREWGGGGGGAGGFDIQPLILHIRLAIDTAVDALLKHEDISAATADLGCPQH